MHLRATYEDTHDEYVLIRFSVEVPHFPRVCGTRSIDYNNTLLGRAADIPALAAEMAVVNQRCFRVECNPVERVFEDFLRELVTVAGLEYVTDAGRYFIAIRRSPLHAVVPLCAAVVHLVQAHFYPGHQVDLSRFRSRLDGGRDQRFTAS